ncbi:MAG: ABC transporter permease [Gammaproteobacteria bacterium]|nr:ABC transporter permease [Gammaproteobacteria bacterium]
MWRRILAILHARNREFYRDRAGLGWNIVMPVVFVFGFALIFSGEPQALFKVGILTQQQTIADMVSPFIDTKHIDFIIVDDAADAITKIERHQLDLLLDPADAPRYWVNEHSQKGYLSERLMLAAYAEAGSPQPQRQTVSGRALRYVDWVIPGILAMNMMFSCFWGVGWVIVRYRKNGVLRRLQATPLSAFEFLSAQVLSRLLVVLTATSLVYIGADLFLDFIMRGSYLALFIVYTTGAMCLISMGLIIAARLRTEELADGLLNIFSWPMLLLSGVWFSMEGTSAAAQFLSQIIPLTHLVNAARAVMVDGAGLTQVLPEIALLGIMGLILLLIAAALFRWD